MDWVAGRTTTLAKVKLLEMLASIPYREWETHHYGLMTRGYRNAALVQEAREIVRWGRQAQDNECSHLLVIAEKMKAEGVLDPWYVVSPIAWLLVWGYRLLARVLALVSLRRAFLFNAELEDHAEHLYALFVADNPSWESQVVRTPHVAKYNGEVDT